MKGWMISMSWENCANSDSCLIRCHFHIHKSNVGLNWQGKGVSCGFYFFVYLTVGSLARSPELQVTDGKIICTQTVEEYNLRAPLLIWSLSFLLGGCNQRLQPLAFLFETDCWIWIIMFVLFHLRVIQNPLCRVDKWWLQDTICAPLQRACKPRQVLLHICRCPHSCVKYEQWLARKVLVDV